jgi:6-phosphogluconolactonase (cycloisomerase 2 family)
LSVKSVLSPRSIAFSGARLCRNPRAAKTVVLQNNGSNNLPVSANGTVAFSTKLSSGDGYSVTVATQPVGQSCTVTSANGTVSSYNILLAVSCAINSFAVGGTVTGLIAGTSLSLQDAAGSTATITANGAYSFTTPIPSGSTYTVSVDNQPAGGSCTVSNPSGTIADSKVTNVNVSCSGVPYTVSAVVTGLTNVNGLVIQNNGGDNLTITASGTYSFATPVTSGQEYNVTILTQPAGRACSVLSGSGTIMSSRVTAVVACPWHVGYAPQSYPLANGVAAYYVDQSTGATNALAGSPFSAPSGATAIVVSPTAGFLYATGPDTPSSKVLGYAINGIDGSLTPVAGGPFAAGNLSSTVAIDPQGRFLYVGNSSPNTISAFAINTTTGALTAVPGSPFAVEGSPLYLAVSAAGFVYVGYQDSAPNAQVSAFALNPSTGALSEITGSPFLLSTLGSNPWQIGEFAIDPMGRFFYVVGLTGFGMPEQGFYAVDTIDSTSGALAPVTGSPFGGQTAAMGSLVIDRTGSYLYGGCPDDDIILEYSISTSTGVLTISNTINAPGSIGFTAVDPSNTYLFGTNSVFSPYTINHTTGTLTFYLNGATPYVKNAAPLAFSNTP